MARPLGGLNLRSISVRLRLAFFAAAGLTLIAAATAWWVFGVTEASLKSLTATSLPLMSQAISLSKLTGDYATELPVLGNAATEAERAKIYSDLERKSHDIGNIIRDIDKKLDAADGAKFVGMSQINSSLAAAVEKVNDAVSRKIQAEMVLQLGTQEAANAMAAIQTADSAVKDTVNETNTNVSSLRQIISKYVDATTVGVMQMAARANGAVRGGAAVKSPTHYAIVGRAVVDAVINGPSS